MLLVPRGLRGAGGTPSQAARRNLVRKLDVRIIKRRWMEDARSESIRAQPSGEPAVMNANALEPVIPKGAPRRIRPSPRTFAPTEESTLCCSKPVDEPHARGCRSSRMPPCLYHAAKPCFPERVLLNLGSPAARFVILRERPRIT
jgi:hypothetical protein